VSSRKYTEGIWLKFYRAEAFTRQDGSCAYCGIRLRAYEATADHCTPVKNGGLTNRQNIAMACQPCNLAKGHMSVKAFKKRLRDPAPDDSQLIWGAWSRWRLSERTKQAEKRILRWNKLK
jgi:5-methylcytosine-specific restriction endonuclease McrA